MKIHLHYHDATVAHCRITVFLDGANVGELCLRQTEVVPFTQIIENGLLKGVDEFRGTGKSLPQEPK